MNSETQALIGLLAIMVGLGIYIALPQVPGLIASLKWRKEIARRRKWQMYDEHMTTRL